MAFDTEMFKWLVDNGFTDGFMMKVKSLTSRIQGPFRANDEDVFPNYMRMLFTLAGLNVGMSASHTGMTVETARYAYVFEFKVNSSAREAIDQINRKGYADIFRGSGKKILKVGVNYNSASRSISEWLLE